MFMKLLENSSSSIVMKSESITGVNAKVIHVDLELLFCNHVREDVIHECLEYGRGITETEEHDCRFIETERGDKGCLPLVRFLNLNVVVLPTNIELGEIDKVLYVVNKFGNERKGISIANGVGVQILVVLAGTKSSVFLWNKEEWGHLR